MSIRFAAIGLTHNHVFSLTELLVNAGGQLVSAYSDSPDQFAAYQASFPQVMQAPSPQAILDDESIQLVLGIPIPNERADLGIRAMQQGKDYLCDKPGFTTLAQLEAARQAQQATGRKYLVYYSERLANPATVKAAELLQAGAIGRLVQMMGMGPHRMNPAARAEWFFRPEITGGILTDLACHQIDQFLYFSGSTHAEVVTAQVGNLHHPQYPEIDDFGDLMLRNDKASAYARVDWLTPEGLGAWGDVRTFLLGTEGYIELRKVVDVQGRPGGNHLFLINQQGQQYINCDALPLPFGEQLIQDVLHRTEDAIGQEHCFMVSELALKAEASAHRLGGPR